VGDWVDGGDKRINVLFHNRNYTTPLSILFADTTVIAATSIYLTNNLSSGTELRG
jgi:hypothetical protein